MLRNEPRLKRTLAAEGLDALVATTAQNVRYLTDYEAPSLYIHRNHGNFGIATGADREPTLITSLAGVEYIIGRPVATKDIRTTGTYVVQRRLGAVLDAAEEETWQLRENCRHYQTTQSALVEVIREVVPMGGRVGVDETGISHGTWRALAKELNGIDLIEAEQTFAEIRQVKSKCELATLKRAAEINERAAASAFDIGGNGSTELDMEAQFRAESARLGADPIHWETTIGPRSSGSFYSGPFVGRPGDIIRSDCSVRYRMYWADTGRTRVIGRARADHARTYEAILAGQLAMLERIRSGLMVGDVFSIGVETVRQNGIPNYDRHHVGHGIGLEMYETPILVRDSNQRLETGMVINVELPYYELGYVGLQVEDTVVVTDTGCELLTNTDRGIVSVAN